MDPDSVTPSLPTELIASLFWQAADGMFVADSQSRVIAVNARGCDLLGFTAEEIQGRPFQDFVDPEDLRTAPPRIDDLRAGKTVVSERRLRHKDGRLLPVEITVRMMPDGHLLVIGRDLTERRRALEAVKAGETLLRATMEAVADGVLAVDDRGTVLYRNARFAELWRIPQEVADSGDDDRLLGFVLGQLEDPEAFLTKVRALYRSVEESFDTLRFKDGRVFERFSCPLMHDDALAGRVWCFRDVTERRRAEDERLEMERRLFHAQKLESLGVLAGGIAHDFNNLLMAMLGNLELALRELSPVSPARSRLEAASGAARRAAELTRQMLAYSGRGKFSIGLLSLNELVEENLHLLRTSIPETTALNLHLDRALPAVEADAGQVQQVVVNLITNASEAIGSEPGVITLSTGVRDFGVSDLGQNRLDEAPPAGRYAYLEVADTGCGMDEQTQKRMFDPFFTTKFTGRGLGMAAVLGIMRGHRGAILLDSAQGKGAVVRVLFPAVEAAPGAARSSQA